MRTQVKRAFTLIEILIVVVILGILAAIVIPQFTDASQEAMESNLRSQLQTLRGQIELYNIQNPTTAYDSGATLDGTFWDPMISGDYIQAAPRNPLQNSSTTIAAAAADGVGWVWRQKTGGTSYTLYTVDENGAEFVE